MRPNFSRCCAWLENVNITKKACSLIQNIKKENTIYFQGHCFIQSKSRVIDEKMLIMT